MAPTPIFKTEALHLVTYLATAVLNDCYSEYSILAYSVFMMCMHAKVTPTDDTDYSCHIKPQNLFNQSHIARVYITIRIRY